MFRYFVTFLHVALIFWISNPAWGQGTVRFTKIGLKEGLSQSSAFALCQDYLGFMWIGTRDGLNRYDSRKFFTYRNVPGDSTTLTDNYILSLLEDSKKNLWVGTRTGLNRYDRSKDKYVRVSLPTLNASQYPMVWAISEDKDGQIWVSTNHGLFCLSGSKKELVYDISHHEGLPDGCNNVFTFLQDHDKDIWIGTGNGVLQFKPYVKGKRLSLFRHYKKAPGVLNSDEVRVVVEAKDGVYWFGTKEGGLNVFDKAKNEFRYWMHRPEAKGRSLAGNDVRSIIKDRFGGFWIGTINGLNYYTEKDGFQTFTASDFDPFSISNNSIRPIYQDARGSVWVGTFFGGVSVYDRHLPIFHHQFYSPYYPSLSYNVVGGILQDERGNLWIGTEGGGLNYMEGNQFKHYKHDPTVPGTLSHNHVKSLYLGKNGDLWIGTYNGGLNILKKGSSTFLHYKNDSKDPGSLANNNVYAIREDRSGNIWLGTYGGGLSLKRAGDAMRFEHYQAGKAGEYHLSSDLVRMVYVDSKDNLWVGTESGLNLKRAGQKAFEVFRYDPNNPKSISGDVIITIFEDAKKRIWLGTYKNGLNLYDEKTKTFKRFTEKDGLAGNNIFGILEDKGLLWISTNNGICSFDPETGKTQIYNSKDGIGGNEFSVGAYLKARDGKLYFGGTHGLTSFYPSSIHPSTFVPTLVFTDFKLFNESVVPGDEKILNKPISITDTVVLNHKQNIFTVEFSAINFILPEKNKYAYRLEGLEEQWNYVDNPTATYTNLNAGTYTLLVKGSSNDGIWNEVPARLTIKILPPPWKTWWAYTLYGLLIAGSIYLIVKYTKIKSRLEHELALEHLENERQREINEIKLNFFTSISHEFRTPLTLILAPVQHMLSQGNLDGSSKKLMTTVKNNSLRLLNLVNQLLDFRKQESGTYTLNKAHQDMSLFLDQIAMEFTHYAKERGINFFYEKPYSTMMVEVDRDEMEKVIYNLLSNAFKFVPSYGIVKMDMEVEAPSADFPEGSVVIRVWDNGPGIPEEERSSIFDFFYQSGNHSGSGIGLALAKNITELHGGKISVDSSTEDVTYTCFSVHLPSSTGSFVTLEPTIKIESTSSEEPEVFTENGKPMVLIVEDNEEIRQVISQSLEKTYAINEAANGQEGWQKVRSLLPDLVITDIMMPVEDGITLLRNIKQNVETNHIPVLLLTARTAMESVIEGLQSGSDDYVTKPFHPEVLSLKIRNILESRERFRRKFIRDYVLTPANEVEEPDQVFLKKVISLIEENLAESEFNVNTLARELSMSRPVLYRKLKQLTDLSVIELISLLRLKKGAQLLCQEDAKVSQVAYQIGFSDPKYFSKSFKSHFGLSPTEYAALSSDEQAELIHLKFK